jgi:hypothetical protein
MEEAQTSVVKRARAGAVSKADIVPREDRNWVGRIGSFVLAGSDLPPKAKFDGLARQIADELGADSRVTEVEVPEIETDWCARTNIYPSPADEDDLVTGADRVPAAQFNEPLFFKVVVPVKNQRVVTEGDEIPTDYQVLWDGITVLVSWKAPKDRHVPLSGGHVVSEILRQAVEKLGFTLYVQGCSPVCRHEFTHTSLRFIKDSDPPEKITFKQSRWRNEVEIPYPADIDKPQARVFENLSAIAEEFTILKNLGRRILEIENDGRNALGTLMAIDLERAQIVQSPWKVRARQLWQSRSWRKRSRHLVSRVWAALANIERLRRQWSEIQFRFDRSASAQGKERLFVQDYANEVDRVSSFNPDLMRSAVQEIGTRLDNRALIAVTGLGLVAGAIAGGVVGGITGSL